jgi:hypothetical protein
MWCTASKKEKPNLMIRKIKHVRFLRQMLESKLLRVKSIKISDLHLIACRHHGILRSKNVPLIPLKGLKHAVMNSKHD